MSITEGTGCEYSGQQLIWHLFCNHFLKQSTTLYYGLLTQETLKSLKQNQLAFTIIGASVWFIELIHRHTNGLLLK